MKDKIQEKINDLIIENLTSHTHYYYGNKNILFKNRKNIEILENLLKCDENTTFSNDLILRLEEETIGTEELIDFLKLKEYQKTNFAVFLTKNSDFISFLKIIKEEKETKFYKINILNNLIFASSELKPNFLTEIVLNSKTFMPIILVENFFNYSRETQFNFIELIKSLKEKKYYDNYLDLELDFSKFCFVFLDDNNNYKNNEYIDNFTKIRLKELLRDEIIEKIQTKIRSIFDKSFDVNYFLSKIENEFDLKIVNKFIDDLYIFKNKNSFSDEKKLIDEWSKKIGYSNFKKISEINYSKTSGLVNIIGHNNLNIKPIISKISINKREYNSYHMFKNMSKHHEIILSACYNIAKKIIDTNNFDNSKFNENYLLTLNDPFKDTFDSSGMVSIITAYISFFLDIPIKEDIAFIGFVDLNGKINKVQNIYYKILICLDNDINKIYIPKENEEDLLLFKKTFLTKIEVVLISNYQEVFDDLFLVRVKKINKKS